MTALTALPRDPHELWRSLATPGRPTPLAAERDRRGCLERPHRSRCRSLRSCCCSQSFHSDAGLSDLHTDEGCSVKRLVGRLATVGGRQPTCHVPTFFFRARLPTLSLLFCQGLGRSL